MKNYTVSIPVYGEHVYRVEAESEDEARKKVIYSSGIINNYTDLKYNWLYMKIDGKYLSKEDDYS